MRERIHRRGQTARQIAERAGVSVRTVQAWTSIPRDVYEQTADRRREQIVRLYRDEEVGVREIARRLNLSPGLVSLRLREARQAGVLPPA